MRGITPVQEKPLTNHDLVSAVEDYRQPFLILVGEEICRERHQGHKHEKNDVDPEKNSVIADYDAELFLMECPINPKNKKAQSV
jgi:hypothetical protein